MRASIQPKKTPKNDEASNDFRPELTQAPEVNRVRSFAKDSEGHVKHSENNGHLHLNTVDERQLVLGLAPNGVLAERVDALIGISSPYEFAGLATHDRAVLELLCLHILHGLYLVHTVA